MPDFNPANPGDLVYPKYAAVTTEPISASLQIVKGVIYTVSVVADATKGRLIAVAATLKNGFFQAMSTPVDVGAVGNDDTVQVAGPRTRMLLNDLVGGLVVGDDVTTVPNTSNVAIGAATDALYIGKVFEIYNLQADNISQKYVTVPGDKVIVETVQV